MYSTLSRNVMYLPAKPSITCLLILSLFAQEQYVLIHDALNDYITCGDTSVVAYQLRMAIHDLDKEEDGQSGFERQFEVRTHHLPY